jgi:hemolysin III
MDLDKTKMDCLISSLDSNEYFNSISHLLGAILTLAAVIILIVFSVRDHKWLHLISFAIYGATLLLSMIASCLLHFFLLFNRYKRRLAIFDHCAIYAFIAGTYTPFCVVVLHNTLGWVILGAIWGLAILNITLKIIFFLQFSKSLSQISYMAMGWLGVVPIYCMYLRLNIWAPLLIMAAGVIYTLGAAVFFHGKPNPFPPHFGNHEIWHVSVLLGNATLFCVMLFFVLPYHG